MSNATEQLEEPTANPYNSKKAWHTPDAPSRGKADTSINCKAKGHITNRCSRKPNLGFC